MSYSTESILLPLQKLQQEHDELAHRDILNFNLHKRLKHMVLHFFKYAGKIQAAGEAQDRNELRRILLDAFIICMATANALNVSLGRSITVIGIAPSDLDALAHKLANTDKLDDPFASAVRDLVLIGGRMAKAVESADHMEDGNPRGDMAALVPELTHAVLAHLGHHDGGLEQDVRLRLVSVEKKSIFS